MVNQVDSFSQSGNTVTFSTNILPGGYNVRIQYDGPTCFGWMYSENPIEIEVGSLEYTLTEVGTEGGMFRVKGKVSEGAILKIDGQKGYFSHP